MTEPPRCRPRRVRHLSRLLGGLVDQQLANDPGGDRFRRLLGPAIDMWADGVGIPKAPPSTTTHDSEDGPDEHPHPPAIEPADPAPSRLSTTYGDAAGGRGVPTVRRDARRARRRRLDRADRLPGLGRAGHGLPRGRDGRDAGRHPRGRPAAAACRPRRGGPRPRLHRRAHRAPGARARRDDPAQLVAAMRDVGPRGGPRPAAGRRRSCAGVRSRSSRRSTAARSAGRWASWST